MELDKSVRKKVTQQLGHKIPPASDESFWPFVEQLRTTHPELADELEENVIFDDLGDPEREAQRADARAVAFRMGYRRLFYRFDEVRQTWHLHRGKLLGWGVGAFLAFFLPAFYYRPAPPTAQAANVAAMSGGSMSGGAIAEPTKLPQSEELPEPEPLIVEQPRESEPPAAPLVAQPAAPVVPLTQPQDPATAEPGSLRAYSKEDLASSEVRGLNAYRRNGQAGGAPQAGGGDPFADGSSTVQRGGLSAYQKPQAGAESAETGGLNAYTKEVQTNPLRSPGDPNAPLPGAEGSGGVVDPLFKGETVEPQYAEVSAVGTQAADPFAAPPTQDPSTDVSDPAAGEAELVAVEMYKPGDTVEGELAVGLIALGEDALPVIARGRDGSVWQGQAVLNASGRVDITFTNASGDSGSQSLEAIALADDGYAGVPAAIKETTPALASDLARGALRGASEFVEGLRDQSSVTLSNGAAVVSRDAPPLDASVLGSVARLFTPPEGDDQQALVRLAEVPSGTKFQIMVLGAGQTDSQTP